MAKQKQPLQILLGPIPPALIACGNEKETNIITLAWVGVVNSSPPMISAAVRPSRYSHDIIRDTGEFTVNLPKVDQVELTDGCGTLSGKDLDKFEYFNLTAVRGSLKHAPMIAECPISMECRVEQSLELGSHTLFIGQVISSYVEEEVLAEKGKIDHQLCRLLGFCAGSYLQTVPLDLSQDYTQKNEG